MEGGGGGGACGDGAPCTKSMGNLIFGRLIYKFVCLFVKSWCNIFDIEAKLN